MTKQKEDVIIKSHDYTKVKRTLKFLRQPVLLEDLISLTKLDKEIVIGCLVGLQGGGYVKRKGSGYEYIVNDIIFACNVCKFTALSQNTVTKHMIDAHVTQYVLGNLHDSHIKVKKLK